MRKLEDYVYDGIDENEITEEQHISLGETGLVATSFDRVMVIRREEEVVAIVQNGMLHESITLFEVGLEELLVLDGLPDVEPYELDPIPEFMFEEPFPTEAAVWLKRMPGPFMTSSTLRTTPERVHPLPEGTEFTLGGDDFMHILIAIEMAARDERESKWRTTPQRWGF